MSTSAQNYTPSTKSVDKSINPSLSSKDDDGDYFLVSRGSLLRSKDATLVPSGSTGATSDTKDNQKIPDEKTLAQVPKAIALGKSIKNVMKGAKRSGGNTLMVHAKLVNASLFTSGANATQFPVVTIQASTYQDFTYFQNVYDEYRVREVEIHACVQPSASPTTLGRAWGLAFDPGNSGAYSVIYDTLSAQRSMGPVAIPSVILSNSTGTGFQTLRSGKLLPLLNAGGGVLTAVVGGMWCSTSDNSCIHGYVKGAVDAIGAALTTTISIWTVLHCEFRMRT